ncbi:hypothetical protein PT2222_140393 [Paraburkholderia tropica]
MIFYSLTIDQFNITPIIFNFDSYEQ